MFTAPTVGPTTEYEAVDSTKRNMYEMVSFKNGAAGPVHVVHDRNDYGVIEAGTTVNLPKFVAEWLLKRNKFYEIVAGGEPEVTEKIENDRKVLVDSEITAASQAEKISEEKKIAKKKKAEDLQAVADNAKEETDLDDTEDSE